MKNLRNKIKSMKGITLIALVITIVILIILAGIVISTILGNYGLLNRSKTATEEHNKQIAIESMNLKITTYQINTYTKAQRMPSLKELAVELEKDNEIQYVNGSKRVASTQDINFTTATSIFTKLKAYPYEFEINSSLQLASIDGVKVSSIPANDDDTIISMTKAELRDTINSAIDNKLELYSKTTDINQNYATKEEVNSGYTFLASITGNSLQKYPDNAKELYVYFWINDICYPMSPTIIPLTATSIFAHNNINISGQQDTSYFEYRIKIDPTNKTFQVISGKRNNGEYISNTTTPVRCDLYYK